MVPCEYLDLDEENGGQESTTEGKYSLKEKLISNNNEANKTVGDVLFNSFLLNEIKAQDDAFRQVMSISALLIGAYATVIVNSFGKLSTNSLNDTIWICLVDIKQGTTGSELQIFYPIFLIPILIWTSTLWISVMNLSPSTKMWPYSGLPDSNRKQDEALVVSFLMNTAQIKYRTYRLSSLMMVLGLMAAISIVILSMPRT